MCNFHVRDQYNDQPETKFRKASMQFASSVAGTTQRAKFREPNMQFYEFRDRDDIT